MGTTLIVTFGFDEKFCYRAIMRNGIGDGDRIILITAGAVEKVLNAYDHVRKFVSTTYNDVKVELIEVNPRDFVSGVLRVLEILRSVEGRVVVNLSGGMRVLSLMVYAALTLLDKGARIEIELEDFSGVVEISEALVKLPRVLSTLSDEKIKLVKTVKELGEVEAMKLAKILGKDASTVRRHIYELEEASLVEIVSRKPLKVRASKLVDLL